MATTIHPHQTSENAAGSRAEGWAQRGLWAGLAGAATVAVLFLILDLLAGRPLWTPTALGSALFFDEVIVQQAAPRVGVVLAYTILHGTVFAAAGLIASFLVQDRETIWWQRLGGLTAAIFLALEGIFLGLGALFAPLLVGAVGLPWITAGNFVAAAAMAFVVAEPRAGS